MKYYSLNQKSQAVDFGQATLHGQAPDKGLYFPETIPVLSADWLDAIGGMDKEEMAFHIMKPYIGKSIPDFELKRIISETLCFPFPLVKVSPDIMSLELYHGPTLAFKDVGARFMSRCLSYLLKDMNKKVTVLVATSGDTGGAVASGFYGVEGVDVVILYPSGKVSSVQELQLTTLGINIHALEIEGSFDDCQRLVKQAFADTALNQSLFLTSANSINVARWLPQQLYYFIAFQQWEDKENPPVISVPSGNFGNICAGLLAHRSGLPVSHFIAACNANAVIPSFLQNGHYEPREAIATLSNAMDVGNPSNFVRILELFNQSFHPLRKIMSSYSLSDAETVDTIKNVLHHFHYLTDPHGAVGYACLRRWLDLNPGRKGFFLETAHPVKFFDVVEPVIDQKIELPEPVRTILHKQKHSLRLKAEYELLKEFLLAR